MLPTITFSIGIEGRAGRRLDDDPPAGKPLAQVVVGVADQSQGDAAGQEGPEALSGRAAEGDLEGAVGQARRAAPLDDAVAEDRAHRAVHVADRHVQPRRLPGCRCTAPPAGRICQSRWSLCVSVCGRVRRSGQPLRPVGRRERRPRNRAPWPSSGRWPRGSPAARPGRSCRRTCGSPAGP